MTRASSAASCSSSQEEKITFMTFCASSEYWKPTLVVLTQMFFSQNCGINVSTFYTVEIFKLSGDHLIEAKFATIVIANSNNRQPAQQYIC